MGKKKKTIKSSSKLENSLIRESSGLLSVKLRLAIIVLAVVISYSPIFFNSLVWDDTQYITNNSLVKELSFSNLKSMFCGEHSFFMGNYHPLTILSLAADCQIFHACAENTSHVWVFHITNLLLHSLNTLMVFGFVYLLFSHLNNRFVIIIASAASLLFGVHTLHVESVAWISERKDVLYAFFFLASLIAYVKYLTKEKSRWFAICFFLFICSLFSKGQAVTLAFTLLAVDFIWGRKLLSFKTLIEKVPFFVLSAAFGIIALKAQIAGNAVQDADYLFYERMLIASYGFIMYIMKLLVPFGLSAYYPYIYSSGNIPLSYYIYFLSFIAIIFAFWKMLKKNREIAFCIVFFILNIFLVLQLVPVGSAIMADRYSYIASIGFFILAAIAYTIIITKYSNFRRFAQIAALFYIAMLMIMTYSRSKVWENNLSLWTDATIKEPLGSISWNNLGEANMDVLNYNDAISNFDKAVTLNKQYALAYVNRGTAKKNIGDAHADAQYWREATDDYNKAIEVRPDFAEAYFNRALVKGLLGDISGEIEDYSKAITLSYNDIKVYLNRGVAFGKAGRIDQAIVDFDKALFIDSKSAEAYENKGSALFLQTKYQDSIDYFNKAINLKPDLGEAFYNRGLSKNELHDYKGAIADFNTVLIQKPDFYKAFLSRGVSYMELQQFQEALNDYDNAIYLAPSWESPFYQKYITLRKLTQKEQACQNLRKAIELGATENSNDCNYCGFKVIN